MDKIDRMIVTEVLQIRKSANESRRKMGLPPRDYTGIPANVTADLQEADSTK